MADWYCSSAVYASVAAFAVTTAYTVGQFIKPTAPGNGTRWVFRCTTAGTTAGSEPSWNAANNGTTTSGTAVFTNVTGQSTYGWSAASGSLYSLTNGSRPVAGDRVFLSSDHSESFNQVWAVATAGFGVIQFISVNRAGSVPPVAGDILAGASIANPTVGVTLDALVDVFWQGITFTVTTGGFTLNSSGTKAHYFKNCAFVFGSSSSGQLSGSARAILDNTTVQFGHTGQTIGSSGGPFDFTWINTASPIPGATLPSILFSNSTSGKALLATCRGIDLSVITGTLFSSANANTMIKGLLDSCKIASAATRFSLVSSTASPAHDEIELVNCYDGTNVINERYTPAGAVTTDTNTYMSGGAQDDIGNYSLKLVSNTRSDFVTLPLECFALDVENTATGSSKTATVEIISSGSLNNNDIRLILQYMGTSGNPIASFGDTLATVLTAASALASSSVTWNNSPSTPQKQYLQVTFTPQRAGRVRGLVRLGKVSTTVWLNPQITIA